MLRIEKGLLTHAEMHGRTTLDDLGLGRMLAAKDCIGRAAARAARARRGGARAAGRAAAGRCRRAAAGGAHLVEQGAAFTAANDLGYLTSACFSPALGYDVALGFL